MKKVVIILILFTVLSVFAEPFYICFGSFTKNENAQSLANDLNGANIPTVFEKVTISGTTYIRVIYNKEYINYIECKKAIKYFSSHRVVSKRAINDLWIRSGNINKINYLSQTKATVVKTQTKTPTITVIPDKVVTEKAVVKEVPKEEVVVKVEPKAEPKTEPKVEEVVKVEPKVEVIEKTAVVTESNDAIYKTIHKDGYSNIIFSTLPIEKGKENEVPILPEFTKPESVYARCYFPEQIGDVSNEDLWHELWIDGEMVLKTFFEDSVDPSWDQIQIWITEEDYADQFKSLDKGSHDVVLWVIKNDLKGEKSISRAESAGTIIGEIEKIFVPVTISKGEFKYIVP